MFSTIQKKIKRKLILYIEKLITFKREKKSDNGNDLFFFVKWWYLELFNEYIGNLCINQSYDESHPK